jgi:putative transposase
VVFLSFVLDAFSRRVVGWQLAWHMRTTLVLDALRMALGMRRPVPTSRSCTTQIAAVSTPALTTSRNWPDHGVLASVGDAHDNALPESFADSFETRLIADRVWRTRSQLQSAVVECIGWFNHTRVRESLGDLPPAESRPTRCGPRPPHRQSRDRPPTAGLWAPSVQTS